MTGLLIQPETFEIGAQISVFVKAFNVLNLSPVSSPKRYHICVLSVGPVAEYWAHMNCISHHVLKNRFHPRYLQSDRQNQGMFIYKRISFPKISQDSIFFLALVLYCTISTMLLMLSGVAVILCHLGLLPFFLQCHRINYACFVCIFYHSNGLCLLENNLQFTDRKKASHVYHKGFMC
jgi:hypothetical protein